MERPRDEYISLQQANNCGNPSTQACNTTTDNEYISLSTDCGNPSAQTWDTITEDEFIPLTPFGPENDYLSDCGDWLPLCHSQAHFSLQSQTQSNTLEYDARLSHSDDRELDEHSNQWTWDLGSSTSTPDRTISPVHSSEEDNLQYIMLKFSPGCLVFIQRLQHSTVITISDPAQNDTGSVIDLTDE